MDRTTKYLDDVLLLKLGEERIGLVCGHENDKPLYFGTLLEEFVGDRTSIRYDDSNKKKRCRVQTFHVKPGRSYSFTVTCAKTRDGPIVETWKHSIGLKPLGYEYMSKEVLHARMIRASNFYHGKFATIEELNNKEPNVFDTSNPKVILAYFHRAKSADYWNDVKEKGAIDTCVRTDSHGHPSPLNFAYGGIPFFARTVMPQSFFGNRNVSFFPSDVLGDNPKETYSFYFADCKCYGNKEYGNIPVFEYEKIGDIPIHYYTIAIARKGSVEQRLKIVSSKDCPISPKK